ncbi:MAG: hypothetical protein HFG53_15865 [Lachnospiraceae bacterium]|jgi:hypothetical protein|nr:hypothetical protein [Lachnospiraceae bacterium]
MRKEFLKETKDRLKELSARAKLFAISTAISCTSALPALAAEDATGGGTDVTSILTSSFETTVNSVIGTVGSVLPMVMQVVGLGVCVTFAIKFFKRFVK